MRSVWLIWFCTKVHLISPRSPTVKLQFRSVGNARTLDERDTERITLFILLYLFLFIKDYHQQPQDRHGLFQIFLHFLISLVSSPTENPILGWRGIRKPKPEALFGVSSQIDMPAANDVEEQWLYFEPLQDV